MNCENYFCFAYTPQYETKLHNAVYKGKLARVVKHIDSMSVYKETFLRETPLFLAVGQRHTEITELLFSVYERDLNAVSKQLVKSQVDAKKCPYGRSIPVCVAFGHNEIEAVKRLSDGIALAEFTADNLLVVILKTSNMESPGVLCLQPRSKADAQRCLDIVLLLRNNGHLYLDHRSDRNDTIACVAANQGLDDILFRVINLGAAYLDESDFMLTPFYTACANNQLITAQKLVANCSDIDVSKQCTADGRSLLAAIASNGNATLFEWLFNKVIDARVKAGAESRDKAIHHLLSERSGWDNCTITSTAFMCGNLEFIEWFANKYQPNLSEILEPSKSLLHLLPYNGSELFERLIAVCNGSELLAHRDSDRRTLLHHAAVNGWTKIVSRWYDSGSCGENFFGDEPEVGMTVVRDVISCGHFETAQYIINKSREKIANHPKQVDLLVAAARQTNTDLVCLLLSIPGADPMQRDAFDDVPLCEALRANRTDSVRAMLPFTTELNELRSVGVSVLELAVRGQQVQRRTCGTKCGPWGQPVEQSQIASDSEADESENVMAPVNTTHSLDDEFPAENIDENLNTDKEACDRLFMELLDFGLDVHVINERRETLVHVAVSDGNLEILKEVLRRGVNPHTPNMYGTYPIHFARRVDIAETLLEYGPPNMLDALDDEKNTVLHSLLIYYVINKTDDGMVGWLIENGVNVNAKNNGGETPLHLVQCVDWFRQMIACGAHVDAADNNGDTVLHALLDNHLYEMVLDLLRDDRVSLLVTNNEGESVLRYFVDMPASTLAEMMTVLDEHKPGEFNKLLARFCNEIDKQGCPLLCRLSYGALLDQLIDQDGIKIDCRFEDNHTPLYASMFQQKETALRKLLAKGANVNQPQGANGSTCLMFAICSNIVDTVAILLEAGADVNVPNECGDTPLHEAVLRKQFVIVCLLLRHGADFSCVNKNGKSPLNEMPANYKSFFGFALNVTQK